MITPILFIGVGGSGRSTLHWVYDDIRRQLIENDWPWQQRERDGIPMPRCWQFLSIDAEYKENKEDPPVPDNAIKHVLITAPPEDMRTIYDDLENTTIGLSRLGWVPAPTKIPTFNAYDGMGQYRGLGRLTVLARLDRVIASIRNAASEVFDADAQSDLTLAAKSLRATAAQSISDSRVVLVSSLAGGTGSGMWLDIAQYLASRPNNVADAWQRQRLISFLYVPEVFENLDGPSSGVAPNSMLAIAELLSAYANRGPTNRIDEGTDRAMAAARTDDPRAPRSVFFIGRRNAGVDLRENKEVFAATARTLAALVLDPSNNSAFDRISVNMTNTNRIPLLTTTPVPSSNIGFSRLDLGNRAVGEYAARRLVRHLIGTMLLGPDPTEADTAKTPEQRVQEQANMLEAEFFTACGLSEEDTGGTRNDQILSGLDGTSRSQTMDVFKTRADALRSKLQKIKKDTGQIAKKELEDIRTAVDDDARGDLLDRTIAYAAEVSDKLLLNVAAYSARYSVPVVLELLDRLDRQLRSAGEQLANESGSIRAALLKPLEDFAEFLKLDDATKYFNKARQIEVRRAAVPFITNVRTHLVQPLRRDLDRWFTAAQLELTSSSTLNAWINNWNGTDVPSDLEPPQTVVMIHEPSTIRKRFEQAMASTFAVPERAAVRAAAQEILFGVWSQRPANPATSSSGQVFITEAERFTLATLRPTATRDHDSNRRARQNALAQFEQNSMQIETARFEFASLADISVTATQWTQTRPGIRDTVVSGFGTWLDRNDPEHEARKKLFITRLGQAVGRAAPTITFTTNGGNAVHGKSKPIETISPTPSLPFSKTSDLANSVRSVIESHGLATGNVSFSTGSNATDPSRIDFLRSYPDGLHPLALSSVTQPVLDALGNADESFWTLRRARPLAQTTGFSPAQTLALLRGWLVLQMLNLVDPTTGSTWFTASPIQIPRDFLDIGQPTKQQPTKSSGWLRVALLSAPVRLMRYTSDTSSLDWYEQVIALGGYRAGSSATEQERLVNTHGVESAPVRNAVIPIERLSAWVHLGSIAASDRFPDSDIAGTPHDPSSRTTNLTAWINKSYQLIDKWASQAAQHPDEYFGKQDLSPESEMFPYFLAALTQLLTVVSGAQATDTNDGMSGPVLS